LEIVGGDLRDLQAVQAAVDGCGYIFHPGALISIPYSYRHPREVAETNLMGTLNLLQASYLSKADGIIHTSTSEVYGTARYVPIDEYHPLQGKSPYSASKIGVDKLAESFYCAYRLPVVIVRPFTSSTPLPLHETEDVAAREVTLPLYPAMTDDAVNSIVQGVIAALEEC